MPQVYEVTARFRRQTQPVQYQAAESELVVKAQFSEQEYQAGDAAKLLAETQNTVLTSLGLSAEASVPVVPGTSAAAGGGEAVAPKQTTRKKGAAAATAPAGAAQGDTAGSGQAQAAAQSAPANPADMSSMDGPGDPATLAKPEGISDEDLQKTASAAAQRCGSAAKVKALMKEFSVARLGELPQDRRKEFVAKCDGLKKDE